MHPAYFETNFRCCKVNPSWPSEFSIITGYATTGEHWPQKNNEQADRELVAELRCVSDWVQRLTGFSPSTRHAEPGWAVSLPWQVACDTGPKYRQDAIYVVTDDTLWVTYCDERRSLVKVGGFRERVKSEPG